MTAAEIAGKLGGPAVRDGQWWRCRCPVHRANRALALRDTLTGIAVKCFAGCTRWEILRELSRQGLVGSGEAPKEGVASSKNADEKRRIANARDLWSASYAADATTQIHTYLTARSINLPPPATIRIHGLMYHKESGEARPAMAARCDHLEHGHTATHFTFLAIDGSCKATIEPNRKVLGPVAGAAVRLAALQPDNWLVGEGIETVLSVMQMTGLPGWAALSATGLENLVLPAEVRRVLIAADNDVSGRGEEAARSAAGRWAKEGRRVRISMPPIGGQDFNDVLRAGERAGHGG